VGISNYRHEPSPVELRAPIDAGSRRVVLDGCADAVLSLGLAQSRGVWRIDIPARETVALIFEDSASTQTKAG